MKTLILMRHAKSDWKTPELADHDRPLNARGRRSAPVMAAKLINQGLTADVILASTAVRVQETLQLLQETWGENAEVLTEKALYLAAPEQIAAQIQSLHDSWQSALVIGHNPGLSMLLSALAGDFVEMPTAAVAVLKADIDTWQNSIAQPKWTLASLWKPRELME